MQPIAEPTAHSRGVVDRLVIGLLIGAVAVSVGAVALLTVYMNRIGDAAAGVRRVDPLGAYDGRPAPVGTDGAYALNYLLMTTDARGELDAVLIAHLSASRRNLTLITLPADLLVDGGRSTLAADYAIEPRLAARSIESITQARMDHQVHLDVAGFGAVVDSLGGLELPEGRLSGNQVLGYLDGSADPAERSARTAELLRAALAESTMSSAIADPNRFDKVLDALTPCVTVDAGLTAELIEATMVESRVHAEEVATWPLGATAAAGGALADPVELTHLRRALASDDLATTAQAKQAAWQASAGPRR